MIVVADGFPIIGNGRAQSLLLSLPGMNGNAGETALYSQLPGARIRAYLISAMAEADMRA